MSRAVTEDDLRKPEFRGVDPKDYEFREDGQVVRKDRWETGLRSIASTLGYARRSYEISEIVADVEKLVQEREARVPIEEEDGVRP